MINEIEKILKDRPQDRLGQFFYNHYDFQQIKNTHIVETLFLHSENDIGVSRNGGRRGTKFAPQSILNSLKKMANHKTRSDSNKICLIENALGQNQDLDFNKLQKDSIEKIKSHLETNPTNVIHLGGGHDHIYPFLKALDEHHNGNRKITVLNIDAHLDTRTDSLFHSGTPFRQFSDNCSCDFRLIQLGIHSYANSESTFKDLENGTMDVITKDDIARATNNFTINIKDYLNEVISINSDELVILSLDCDAIKADIMEGVSAVNHDGLPLSTVQEIFEFYRGLKDQPHQYFGIYEYNPVYDNLSQKGSRALASLLYPII